MGIEWIYLIFDSIALIARFIFLNFTLYNRILSTMDLHCTLINLKGQYASN